MTVMPSRQETIRKLALLLAGVVPLLASGCAQKHVQAAAPVAAPPLADVRPMTIAPDTDATPPLEVKVTPPPALPAPSANAPTVNIVSSQTAPPPRRPATTSQPPEESAEQDAASRPEPLGISPQLSPSDQATYQRQTEDDSGVATKNLQAAGGKQLNATQQDLASKVREALAQATDAGKVGDWIQAQKLAQRARSLSVELVNSL
jgi:hypothetical protein